MSRGDLVSVLTVEGVVVATPEYGVLAEVDDEAVQRGSVEPGDPVQAETPVAWQGGTELVAPVASFLEEWLVPAGVPVHRGVPVALVRYAGLGVVAEVPPEDIYRLYDGSTGARVQASGGPGPVECQPLPAPDPDLPEPAAEETSSAGMMALCAIPKGTEVVAGAPATLGLTTGERSDVLLLPAQAVAGSAGQGTVARLVDGEPVLTEVTLGITDGVQVEIVDGLAEGDRVWPYGPNLLPAVQ